MATMVQQHSEPPETTKDQKQLDVPDKESSSPVDTSSSANSTNSHPNETVVHIGEQQPVNNKELTTEPEKTKTKKRKNNKKANNNFILTESNSQTNELNLNHVQQVNSDSFDKKINDKDQPNEDCARDCVQAPSHDDIVITASHETKNISVNEKHKFVENTIDAADAKEPHIETGHEETYEKDSENINAVGIPEKIQVEEEERENPAQPETKSQDIDPNHKVDPEPAVDVQDESIRGTDHEENRASQSISERLNDSHIHLNEESNRSDAQIVVAAFERIEHNRAKLEEENAQLKADLARIRSQLLGSRERVIDELAREVSTLRKQVEGLSTPRSTIHSELPVRDSTDPKTAVMSTPLLSRASVELNEEETRRILSQEDAYREMRQLAANHDKRQSLASYSHIRGQSRAKRSIAHDDCRSTNSDRTNKKKGALRKFRRSFVYILMSFFD